MKKTVLFLSIMCALVACKKEETPNTTTSSNDITITGKAFAQLDLSSTSTADGGLELVPAGTKITAFVPMNDLRLKADTNLNGRFVSFPGAVGSDGTYTIKFAAPTKTVNIRIVFDDFSYEQVQPTGSDPSTIRKVFYTSDVYLAVDGGTKRVVDRIWNY